MPRVPTSILPVLAVALWPVQGQAQEGPSFNCRYAQTATEHAICASPGLAAIEMRMYRSYLGLVDAVGERQARRIADRFLERRQACGADAACIARRLEITMRVFDRRAGGDTVLASREPSEEELTGLGEEFAAGPVPTIEEVIEGVIAEARPGLPDDIPSPMAREDIAPVTAEAAATPEGEEVASAEPADPDLPLAAQAPLPSDLDPLLDEPAETAAAEPPPSPDQLDEAIAGAELASSDQAASFDQPISWAYMDLIRHQRAEVQSRLQAAGFYEGPAEGGWDRATQDAFEAFFASDEGRGFDPSTENGAALALDFIRSDTFAEAHGIALDEDAADPLTSTEW
jgi:Putative peptidoglycan binding domain